MNKLKELNAFQKVLTNYHASDTAQALLRKIKLVLLVAPSSVGRNTVIDELKKTGRYHFIVSDTTRQPRANNGVLEKNGREYWFRDEDEMLGDLQAGQFLEAAIIHNQQVSGVSIRELQTAYNDHKIAISDLEVKGATNIVAIKPDTLVVFMLPPNFKEWMNRLHGRGQMEPAELQRRLKSAAMEYATALEYPYYQFIINDIVDQTAIQVDQLVQSGKQDPDLQATGRALAMRLYEDTQTELARQQS